MNSPNSPRDYHEAHDFEIETHYFNDDPSWVDEIYKQHPNDPRDPDLPDFYYAPDDRYPDDDAWYGSPSSNDILDGVGSDPTHFPPDAEEELLDSRQRSLLLAPNLDTIVEIDEFRDYESGYNNNNDAGSSLDAFLTPSMGDGPENDARSLASTDEDIQGTTPPVNQNVINGSFNSFFGSLNNVAPPDFGKLNGLAEVNRESSAKKRSEPILQFATEEAETAEMAADESNNAADYSLTSSSESGSSEEGPTITLPSALIPGMNRISVEGSVDDLFLSATSRRDSAMNANREATAQILADNLTLSDDAILWTKIKLRYHFMNPCLKYRAKGTKPVKLIVQIIKIIFVTLQLSLFSKYQFDFRLFIDGNFDSFNHLFLWDWEMGYSDPVQRVPNPYAVFHIADFFDSVDYTVTSYFTLTYNALGNFSYPVDSQVPDNSERINEGGSIPSANVPNNQIPPVKIRFTYYNATEKDGNPYEIQLEPDPLEMDYFVFHNATTNGNFSMERWLVKNQITLNWSSLISIELSFSLVNQHIGSMRTYFKPVCYLFDIRIVYDNSRHTGKLSITHSYTDQTTKCISITYEYSETGWFYMIAITVMDCCIIVLAIYSMVLCIRSLQNNLHLRNVTRAIWLKKLQKPLGKEDEAKFVQYWYFIIMFGDASLVAGSLIKIFITFRVVQVYTICAVLLGCATMIVWLGVLKYLNYFDTYNTLLLTLKFSMPNVLRFLVCCLFIYFGFALAGWAVFGPYHYKFRSFVSTMQTMYSLINGDDMFVTFSEMETSSALVYVFNQVWLYVFIGLFIYCVLSLFIGIITETYEHIREAREHVHVKSELERFYDDIPEDPNCTSFQQLRASRMFICVCCMDDHIDNLRHPEHCMQQNST